ncbi:MAG TPA: choice-of-anchor R domain-containing protein [Bryobacteraceae bacterium]|nr:choice-of-anchor R domain-containing protein [Bryobacteraceae bacterium]
MKKFATKLFFALGLLGTTAAVSSAGVIYSTDGTATPGFFPLNGAASTSSVFHAFQFTVGAGDGGALDELVVAGQSSTGFTETFDILSDDSGSIGSLLDTIPVTVTGDGVSRLYSASPATSLTLVAGTTYWLEATSPSGSDSFLWLEADPIVNTTEFSSARTGTFPDQPSEAFALLDAPAASGVPEPATCLLSLFCILPLAYARPAGRAETPSTPANRTSRPRARVLCELSINAFDVDRDLGDT